MMKSLTISVRSIAVIALATASMFTTPAAFAKGDGWMATWARAMRSEDEPLEADEIAGAVVRTYVPVSTGGTKVRIRFSNRFGRMPLSLENISVARPDGPGGQDKIVSTSSRPVTFGGKESVTIPAGAYFESDPVDMSVTGLSRLAITFRMPKSEDNRTLASMPKGVTFIASNAKGDEASLPAGRMADRVYQLNAVSVWQKPAENLEGKFATGTIAALGDSITDAGGASFDWRGRWTDVLARRLQANPATADLGVVNLGISGGRVARDRSGPSALARLDHDVLSLPELRTLIVFIGVNDIGMMVREREVTSENRARVVEEIIGGYREIIRRAHQRDVRVIAIPILPYGGVVRDDYLADPQAQSERRAVNSWVRSPGNFDGVIELEKLMSDPASPDNLNPRFDRGDHLHPNAKGQNAMGTAIPLDLFN